VKKWMKMSVVALLIVSQADARSYKSKFDRNSRFYPYVPVDHSEEISLCEKLKKEKFSQEYATLIVRLRKPSLNEKEVPLQTFVQGLLNLELNEEQMNLAIKVLYPQEIEKLSLSDFSNKYTNERRFVFGPPLSSIEKENKKNEYEADRFLLKYMHKQKKDKNDKDSNEIRTLLRQINKQIEDWSVNANIGDKDFGAN